MQDATKILKLDFDILHADLLENFLNDQLKEGLCLELVSHKKGLFREKKNAPFQYKVKVFIPKKAYPHLKCSIKEKEKLFLKEWSDAGFVCIGKIDSLYIFKGNLSKVPVEVKDEHRFIRYDFLWNKLFLHFVIWILFAVSFSCCFSLIDGITYNSIIGCMLCYLLYIIYVLSRLCMWFHYKHRMKQNNAGSLLGMKRCSYFSSAMYIVIFLCFISGFLLDGLFLPNWSLIIFICCLGMICLSIYFFIILSELLPYKLRLICVGIIVVIGLGIISAPKWCSPLKNFVNPAHAMYSSKNSTLLIQQYYNFTSDDNTPSLEYLNVRFKGTTDSIFNNISAERLKSGKKISLSADLYDMDSVYYTENNIHKLYLKKGTEIFIFKDFNNDLTLNDNVSLVKNFIDQYVR